MTNKEKLLKAIEEYHAVLLAVVQGDGSRKIPAESVRERITQLYEIAKNV